MFIVLEGLDGSGKTTQLNNIVEHLKSKYPDKKMIITREPGGYECELSEKIRDIILSNEMNDYTRALLYAASRYEHQLKIKQWIEDDYIVICDRYIYSSLAYQAECLSDIDEILTVNRYNDIIKPDFVLYFDISIDTYRQRKASRQQERELDAMEKKKDEFFLKSLNFYKTGFREAINNNKTIVYFVNANSDLDTVTNYTLNLIDNIFEEV